MYASIGPTSLAEATTKSLLTQGQQQQCTHDQTDSVSSVATKTNHSRVSSLDWKKTPKYVAVGVYDGTVVLYHPHTGEKIRMLDGLMDVELIAFHPKVGSVSTDY